MRAALLLASSLLLAGCLGAASSPVRVVPYVTLHDAQPGRATEFALFLESTSAFKQSLPVSADGLPDGWTFEPETPEVTLPGGGTGSLVVRIAPDANATHGPRTIGVKVGETRAEVLVNVRDLGERPIAAGMGARVHYVLFLSNGTMVSTNLKAAADQPGVARGSVGDENGTDAPDYRPLKVYVGGRRGEPPPEPYNSTGCADDEEPPCYHPVIPGFDARLRGMVEGETLAVRVAKEEAYTVPGNEEHPLYGMDLGFLVRVVGVDVFTMRACELPVCPP